MHGVPIKKQSPGKLYFSHGVRISAKHSDFVSEYSHNISSKFYRNI